MCLTDLQRRRLIEDINRLNINVVLKYFLKGDISLSDVPHISDDRRNYIEEHLPSPAQMDWDALQASLSEVSVSTLQKLETYIFYLCTRKQVQTNWLKGVKVNWISNKKISICGLIPSPNQMFSCFHLMQNVNN